MKSFLVLGTGIDQTFGIKKAEEMGLYTNTFDANTESYGDRLFNEI